MLEITPYCHSLVCALVLRTLRTEPRVVLIQHFTENTTKTLVMSSILKAHGARRYSMSLLKTLKDSDCSYCMFIFHNSFVLTIPSHVNLLCMRVSTTWQLWLLDWIHLSQNVWCYTGDTCVSVLCECVYDWLSMLVQLYMLYGRGLQHSICALPNPFSCKWNKICLNQEGIV